jgi:hypothetical protein
MLFAVLALVLIPQVSVAFGSDDAPPLLAGREISEIEYFSLGLNLGSNGFSLGDYGMYNGRFLTDSHKRDIVGSVPDGGLSIFSTAEAQGGGAVIGELVLTMAVRAGENARMPRDVLELVLFGNETGKTYRLDDATGDAVALAEMGAFYSWQVASLGENTALGGGIRVIKGLAYGGITQARGSLHSGETSISGDGRIELRTARGGMGYGMDLGLRHRTHNHIDIYVYVRNVFSTVRWNRGCREEVNTFLFDNVILGGDDPDSLIESANESRDIAAFTTRMVPQLHLAVARPVSGMDLALIYKQGLGNGALVTSEPEFTLRARRRVRSWLEVEGALGWDGRTGMKEGLLARLGRRTRLVLGIGVSQAPWPSSLKQLSLDLGVTRLL